MDPLAFWQRLGAEEVMLLDDDPFVTTEDHGLSLSLARARSPALSLSLALALALALSLSLSRARSLARVLSLIKVIMVGAGLRLSQRERTTENNFQSVVGELVRGADGLPLAAERTER